jgi:hypothetical protein
VDKRVFICFDPADREWAGHLGQALRHRGWDPSVERSQVHEDETSRQRLVRDLEASEVLVVVLSQASATSRQVIDELALTRKYGTELLAVRIDESTPSAELAKELRGAPTISFHGQEARTQFDKLDRALGRAAAQSYRVMTGELETLMPDDGS